MEDDRTLRAAFAKTVGSFHLEVSLHAAPGEIVGLIGRSGSGKSMTLKSIAGIVTPDRGSVSLGGRVLYDGHVDVPARDRKVGYLFQSYALFPHMTALQNVRAAVRGGSRSERTRTAGEFLSLLGVASVAGLFPRQLSGGQQQRVALARMLANRPSLIMLDEPFSALDEESKRQAGSGLRSLLAGLKVPVLFVSHNRQEIDAYCTRVLRIEDGFCSEA